jgi:hypothetical protein
MVAFNYFHGQASLKISPIKSENERTPKSMYNYDIHTNIVIPRDDALYISWMLENVYMPKLQAGEEFFQAIRIGRANMVAFAVKVNDGKVTPTLEIYRSLDPATLRPAEKATFVFRKGVTLSKYDPEAGDYTANEDMAYDVIKMVGFFKQCADLSGAAYHSYRYENRFVERAQKKVIDSIAGKLGIAAPHPYNDNRPEAPELNFVTQSDDVPQASSASADSVSIEQASDMESALSDLV